MPRWTLTIHRDGKRLRLAYGWDPHLGFFAIVLRHRSKDEFDGLQADRPGLQGFLDFLVEAEVFSRQQVEEALESLLVVEGFDDIENEAVRQVATIVFNVKQAAALHAGQKVNPYSPDGNLRQRRSLDSLGHPRGGRASHR